MALPLTWTAQTDADLLRLRAAGVTWLAVATELHIGRNAAIERARRLGLPALKCIRSRPKPVVERIDRQPLPPGHPLTWCAITDHSPLQGTPYPYPVFL